MTNLPPFARALRRRGDFDDPPPTTRSFYRPEDPEPERFRHRPSPESTNFANEIRDLRTLIADLEQQISTLKTENRHLQRAQVDLDAHRRINEDLQREVDDLRARMEDEQVRGKFLSGQVQQLEGLLESKRQLLDVKEQMIQRLQTEYDQIMVDYQRILDLNGLQTGQLRQSKVQISELESQLEELRFVPKRRPLEPPVERFYEPPPVDIVEPYEPVKFDFSPPKPVDDEPYELPKPRTPVKKSALVDNIHFGDESMDIVADDFESMKVSDMKELLASLRREKEELERKLNKAPEKGRLMAHVRQEQEEREGELDRLVKRIAKIRFELRKLNAL
jgi:chromosome segregation ATPase